MFVDPELVGATPDDGAPPITLDDVPALRAAAATRRLDDGALRTFGIEPTELAVPGPVGEPDVGLLVCRPPEPARGVLVALHGGAMVTGDARGRDLAVHLRVAVPLGLTVVSVDFRLAPEHPFPAPLDDCAAALAWVAEHRPDLGADEAAPIVLAGGSAGGGLAAALALRVRDTGAPPPTGVMLFSPTLDDREDGASVHAAARRGAWDHGVRRLAWSALLAGGAVPARAADLGGLPPTYLDVGSAEVFRDEAVAAATRIAAAGGDVELHVWRGGVHGFDTAVPEAALSRRAREQRIGWLRGLLGRG